MSKDALIRFRASKLLKSKLEALAAKKEQSLSDYLRTRCIEIVAQIEKEENASALDAMLRREDERRKRPDSGQGLTGT